MENPILQANAIIQPKLNVQTPFDFTSLQNKINNILKITNHFPSQKKEALLAARAKPMTKNEIDELYSYESAICKIKYKTLKNGKIIDAFGTGFFCEINDDKIPFKKALFTNNHILNKKNRELNEEIIFKCGKN